MPHDTPTYSPPEPTVGLKYLGLALLLAFVLQVVIVARSPAIENDGVVFINIAKGLLQDPLTTIQGRNQHPGYPAMILASRGLVFGPAWSDQVASWTLPARLAAGLCGLLSVAAVWMLARHFFNARVAAVTAILFAATPMFRRNAADAMSDSPHLLFFLLAAWTAAIGFERWRPGWFLGAGLASGLAYWIRPEGLLVAAVSGAVLACCFFSRRRPDLRVLALCLLALAASSVTVAAPYMIIKGRLTSKKDLRQLFRGKSWQVRQRHSGERVVPPGPKSAEATAPEPAEPGPRVNGATQSLHARPKTRAGQPAAGKAGGYHVEASSPAAAKADVNPTAPPAARPRHAEAAPVEPTEAVPPLAGPARVERAARQRRPTRGRPPRARLQAQASPWSVLVAAVEELAGEILQGLYIGLLVPLAVGLIASWRRRPMRTSSVLVVLLCATHAALLLVLYVIVRYISHRHTMPMLALAMPWVGYGTACVAEGVQAVTAKLTRRAARVGRGHFLHVLVVVMVAALASRAARPVHKLRIPLVEAAAWAGAQAEPGDWILSNSEYVPFYANMQGTVIRRPGRALETTRPVDGGPYRFVVLDAESRTFDPEWLAALGPGYEPLSLPFTRDARRRILVFEPRGR
ncbi:MAG: ArnT family glycosyltransferase [Planctomycetota bacterium]|jgi:4-amino-4-deoxy-L-arabinose transferase-like glycosyltransferase